MSELANQIWGYWQAGGPLLPILAVLSFSIHLVLFRSRDLLIRMRRMAQSVVLDEQVEEQWHKAARRDFGLLASLTAATPLVGLLGTVLGMVGTFDAVTTFEGDTGRQIADGIRQALITTQFGLLVAIPGMFGLARLRRLAQQVDVRISLARHEHALAEAGQ